MWLVGSSSRKKFGLLWKSSASTRRDFSPPDREETFLEAAFPEKRKAPRICRTSFSVRDGNSSWKCSATVRSEERAAVCWSKYPIRTLSPRLQVPFTGGSSPAAVFRKVDFPAPLGPMIPIFCPRRIRRDNSSKALS